MRPDAPSPSLAVLDLLARADALALTASAAIGAGDDEALSAVLEDRGVIVEAALAAWGDVLPADRTPSLVARVRAAAQTAVQSGAEARLVAVRARDLVVAELSVLDARQQASHGYQSGSALGSINVVL